jgi:DNA-binding CsgD family transcriptional regulator
MIALDTFAGWHVHESPSALHDLATVFQASPESDALVVLGRLLDALPIGFHVTDCDDSLHIVYGNDVWEQWLGPARLPAVGKALADVLPTIAQAGVLNSMHEVCRTAQSRHLKSVELQQLDLEHRARAARWDWEIYPLSGSSGEVTHLLNVVMDVSAPTPRPGRRSAAERETANRKRERASGVLRIFGVAPGPTGPQSEALSPREQQVADLLAFGLTNAEVGRALQLTRATVSSHVAHILSKLAFHSRAQVAAWVAQRRLSPGAHQVHPNRG